MVSDCWPHSHGKVEHSFLKTLPSELYLFTQQLGHATCTTANKLRGVIHSRPAYG